MMINNKSNFRIFLILSFILHIAIASLLFFGMPSLFRKLPEDQIITFEMIAVSDKTNLKNQKIQQDKAIEEEKAKSVKNSAKEAEIEKPVEPKTESSKEASKISENPKEQPQDPVPNKVEPKVNAELKEKKAEEKKLPIATASKPKDPSKAVDTKKKAESKKKDIDLNSLLKTLEKASDGKEEKSRKASRSEKTDATTESMGQYDDSNPISISEHQAIKHQIESNWNVPVAAKNTGEITVTLYIALKPDGELMNVKLVSKQCGNAGSITCQAVVDSLFRAVHQASPFQDLSPTRYNAWKEFNIECTPPDI